jgi:hypothetical protein
VDISGDEEDFAPIEGRMDWQVDHGIQLDPQRQDVNEDGFYKQDINEAVQRSLQDRWPKRSTWQQPQQQQHRPVSLTIIPFPTMNSWGQPWSTPDPEPEMQPNPQSQLHPQM